MELFMIFIKTAIPLAVILALVWLLKKILPDTPLTRGGCGG